MHITQTNEQSFGINVFGSAIMRAEPDVASLKFAVSRLAQTPKEAFRLVHAGAESVRAFLAQMGVSEVGASAVNLTQTIRFTSDARVDGYTATITFHVLLRDLTQLEELLSGVVDAGANDIISTDLQTTHLRDLRARVRRRAVHTARAKAENYCKAAGVILGPIIRIEDVNPDLVIASTGQVTRETLPDDDGVPSAANPASIVVSATVMIAFEFGR